MIHWRAAAGGGWTELDADAQPPDHPTTPTDDTEHRRIGY